MSAVLNNVFLTVFTRILHAVPSLDDLIQSMNRQEALRDGSRFF